MVLMLLFYKNGRYFLKAYVYLNNYLMENKMKNIFKIIFILSLTIFAVTGCADGSGGSSENNNTGDINVETIDFDYNVSLLNVRFTPKIVGFDEQNITYQWNFGDNSDISESKNPTHLYYYGGTYKVVLTVFVNGVEIGSKTQLVTVSGDVTYNIDFDYNANFLKVKFTTKLSGYDENYITYKWDFGDNSESSNEANPTHVYETDGTYKVTLTILENGEEKGSETKIITVSKDTTYSIDFDYTASFLEIQFTPNLLGYNEQTVTYKWDFGDGSETSNEAKPLHKYNNNGTYEVTLIALENGVELGSKTEFVTVSRSISYAIDFKYGIYSFEVQFNPNLSGYNKQKITLKWDFGDGSEYSSEANPLYTYRADGTYKVTLTILENGEEKGSKSQYITLNEETYKDFVLTKIIEVDNFVYGETVDGKKYIWGNIGEMGGIGNSEYLTIPKEVTFTVKDAKEYSMIFGATVYVITDVGLYAWGNNDSGQIGNGKTGYVLTPYKVVNGNIKEFKISGHGSLATYYAITEDGLYAWGYKENGQVGNGNSGYSSDVLTPYKVEGIDGNIKEVIANNNTVYVLTDTGLYAWGNNYSGQVGNGDSGYLSDVLTPYKAVNGNIKEFKISDSATYYAITEDGLYAWGYNSDGQVGNGTTSKLLIPYKVEGIDGNIKDIIANNNTVYVLTDMGLYAWGNNYSGQVGNGDSWLLSDVLTPYKVKTTHN